MAFIGIILSKSSLGTAFELEMFDIAPTGELKWYNMNLSLDSALQEL